MTLRCQRLLFARFSHTAFRNACRRLRLFEHLPGHVHPLFKTGPFELVHYRFENFRNVDMLGTLVKIKIAKVRGIVEMAMSG